MRESWLKCGRASLARHDAVVITVYRVKVKAKAKSGSKRVIEECAYCGVSAARPVLLNHTFGRGAKMIVVTEVETMVCDNCGQSYFKGETLKKLDAVLARPRDYATQELVNVASLQAV